MGLDCELVRRLLARAGTSRPRATSSFRSRAGFRSMQSGRWSPPRCSVPKWFSPAPIRLRSIALTIAAKRSIPTKRCLIIAERPFWMPGFGGLCLHTVLPDLRDPKRMIVGISSAGIYRTEDGGESWARRNNGVRMDNDGPPNAPHFRPQCAHKMRYDAKVPARIYLQNHPGMYRSDDGGIPGSTSATICPRNSAFRWSRIRIAPTLHISSR